MTLAVLLLLLALTLLGMPLFAALAGAALFLFHQDGVDAQVIAIEINKLANIPILVALPLFTYTGTLMSEGNGPKRLVDVSRALLGKMPGGVPLVALLICAVFTAFTGTSSVTIVALGGLLYPLLRRSGSSESFSLGLLTTGGSVGLLFPPSLAVILYAIIAEVPIRDLYKASLLPGALMLVALTGLILLQNRLKGPAGADDEDIVELEAPPPLLQALKGAIWDIPLAIGVVVGIYWGFLTVIEAATFSAAYMTVVQLFVHRAVDGVQGLKKVVRESMQLVGAVLVILATAQGFTNYLIDVQIPEQLFDWLGPHLGSPIAFLLALNVFLILVGCMMDLFSAVVVVVPLIMPLAQQYQVDPLHLGVIFLANLELGYATPPVGLNLFIASLRFKRSLWTLYVAALPFLVVLLAAVLAITYIPALSLWWK